MHSSLGRLAHVVEHAVGPSWNINRDLRSAQLCEGLGIQNQEERTFVLETKKLRVCAIKLKSCDCQIIKRKRKSFAFLWLSTLVVVVFFPPQHDAKIRCQPLEFLSARKNHAVALPLWV